MKIERKAKVVGMDRRGGRVSARYEEPETRLMTFSTPVGEIVLELTPDEASAIPGLYGDDLTITIEVTRGECRPRLPR